MKINRKTFIRSLGGILLLPFLYIFNNTIKRHRAISTAKDHLAVPLSTIAGGISFHDSYIVINKKEKIIVLHSGCTHLGCKINKTEGEQLVCPCHGSAFDLEGNCIKGPANRPLKRPGFIIDKEKNQLIIEA